MVGNAHCKSYLFKWLVGLLSDQCLTQCLAKYTFIVLDLFAGVPLYIPLPYTYLPLTVMLIGLVSAYARILQFQPIIFAY